MTAHAKDNFPIMIVGGGLAGLVTALVFARSGHSVTLMDADRPTAEAEKIRTTTLNPYAYAWLENLGVTDHMPVPPTPVHKIEVSDERLRPRPGFAIKDRLMGWDSDAPETPLAYTARNHDLVTASKMLVQATGEIDYRQGARITSWQSKHPTDGHAAGLLEDADGKTYRAELVIACDGGSSPLRELAGIRTIRRNPGQTALVADIKLSKHHQQMAWQRFLDNGPLALMPLDKDDLAALVWTLDDETAEQLKTIEDDRFDAALNDAAMSPFGDLAVASTRFSWPLRLNHAIKPCATRLALVGDAAHSIHPLAGQGFNLAMGDAEALSNAVSWNRDHGLDAGAAAGLDRYARARLAEVSAITLATDSLNLLFGKAPPQLRAATAMAMSLLDRSPLKKLARHVAAGGINRLG